MLVGLKISTRYTMTKSKSFLLNLLILSYLSVVCKSFWRIFSSFIFTTPCLTDLVRIYQGNFWVILLSPTLIFWNSLKLKMVLFSLLFRADVVLCFYCHTQEKLGNLKDQANKESAFISKGYSNWKNALDSFRAHKKSSCHRAASSTTWLLQTVQMSVNYLITS